MSLLALLASLLAQQAYPLRGRSPVEEFYGRLCLSAARQLNAGDRQSGVLAWIVMVGAVLSAVGAVALLGAAIHPVLLWLLDAALLYGSLRFLPTAKTLAGIEAALREQRAGAAANLLAQWRGEPVGTDDAGALARMAAEQALRDAHHGTFALLFWFLLLPGPLGLALYPLARRAAQSWEQVVEPDEREFGWFAGHAFKSIDWVPQRLTAITFAVVGNFEDAIICWRSQAAQWLRPEEGIVLAGGAGALGVRLGDPIPTPEGLVSRPSLGSGEPAREDALASLEGLLWRSLILWLIVYLLAAALQLA